MQMFLQLLWGSGGGNLLEALAENSPWLFAMLL